MFSWNRQGAVSLKKKSYRRFGWLVKQYETEFVCHRSTEDILEILALLKKDWDFRDEVLKAISFHFKTHNVDNKVWVDCDMRVSGQRKFTNVKLVFEPSHRFQTHITITGIDDYRELMIFFWVFVVSFCYSLAYGISLVFSVLVLFLFGAMLAYYLGYVKHYTEFPEALKTLLASDFELSKQEKSKSKRRPN